MAEIISEPWFWPAVIVSLGLPVVLIVLTEIHSALARRNSRAAPIVAMVRNYLVPVAALLILISTPDAWEGEGTWPRTIWTIFGLLVIVVVINAINHLVFNRAEKGSWRDRFPTIFSDLIRFVLILIGITMLMAWVWRADVAGVFAALGVTSIVVGLALQNAVGSIVSGLFLIFESPFQLGDWIEVNGERSRIIEVNWRAVHLDTGNGILVMPTSELADGSFVNLSRNPDPYSASVTVSFATDDPPSQVRALVVAVARDIPLVSDAAEPSVSSLPNAQYGVSIPLDSPGDHEAVLDTFQHRLWYAARRAGLHLDGDITDEWNTPVRLREALRDIAPVLSLRPDELDPLARFARLERYCQGETILRDGVVAQETFIVLAGRAQLGVPTEYGFVKVTELQRRDIIGLTAIQRARTVSRTIAITEVEVVAVPVEHMDSLVGAHPVLAREIIREGENRVRQAREALSKVGTRLDPARRTVG